ELKHPASSPLNSHSSSHAPGRPAIVPPRFPEGSGDSRAGAIFFLEFVSAFPNYGNRNGTRGSDRNRQRSESTLDICRFLSAFTAKKRRTWQLIPLRFRFEATSLALPFAQLVRRRFPAPNLRAGKRSATHV